MPAALLDFLRSHPSCSYFKNKAVYGPVVAGCDICGGEEGAFAKAFNLRLVDLARGYSRVEMVYEPQQMGNIYQRAHGGAIFGLIDEAFETASQTGGIVAVAFNISVTYLTSPGPGSRLTAEARQISESRRTFNFDIAATDETGQLIASCRALAYRTGKPVSLAPSS